MGGLILFSSNEWIHEQLQSRLIAEGIISILCSLSVPLDEGHAEATTLNLTDRSHFGSTKILR
jgi:hypothetical protein